MTLFDNEVVAIAAAPEEAHLRLCGPVTAKLYDLAMLVATCV